MFKENDFKEEDRVFSIQAWQTGNILPPPNVQQSSKLVWMIIVIFAVRNPSTMIITLLPHTCYMSTYYILLKLILIWQKEKKKKSIEANQLIDSVKNLKSKGDKKWHNHLVVSILYQIQQFTLATQGSLV